MLRAYPVMIVLVSVLSVTACAGTGDTKTVDSNAASTGSTNRPDRYPYYYLPVGALDFEVTRSLVCEKEENRASITWEVKTESRTVADVATPLYLNLDELDHFGRDTVATISFTEDGRLAGLNYNSTDQIGPTVSGIITGIVKIALSLAAVGVAEQGDDQKFICKDSVADRFADARKIKAKVDAELKERAKEAAKLGDEKPGSDGHKVISKNLAAIDKAVAEYRKELAKLVEPYSHKQKLALNPSNLKGNNGEVLHPIMPIPDMVTGEWVVGSSALPSGGYVKITPRGDGSGATPPEKIDGTKLYVRMPGVAEVNMYAACAPTTSLGEDKACLESHEFPGSNFKLIMDQRLPLPQAGRLLAIDLDSKIFRDKIVDIEFHTNGTLKKYGTTEKSGLPAVQNTISGVQQSVDAYAAYKAAREAKNSTLTEIQDQNTLLEAQIKLLENQTKLDELKAEEKLGE
jgi:hypothetical protein